VSQQGSGGANGGPNFTLAFKQMASFVAIAKTRATAQVLDELIQQCFVLLPSEPLSTPEQVTEALRTLFGIRLNAKDVRVALDRLQKSQVVTSIGNGHLALSPAAQTELNARVDIARSLEADVRSVWLQQVSSGTGLDGDKLWSSLRAYMAQAFRRHGIQAIELLDSSAVIAEESKSSLSSILEVAIAQEFIGGDRPAAREAVANFFLTVASDRKRAEYIASLADGAFNYFSLAVAPEVSEKLRGGLHKLTLFLDTNFLFGILNLHANSQVDVSSELVDAIRRFKLPFRLRFHEATAREMTNTLFYFGRELGKQKWPQKISRAAEASGHLSGIELRYHAKNAEQPVAVEDFLSPYEHWQVLLKDKGIDVFNAEASQDRLRSRADLEADYKDYLKAVHREKPVDAIQHDMTVLEAVQSLRTGARSTLEAGHLLVTCDYHLFRFDFERCRKQKRHHSTVLPSLLWQILRPFVSDNDEFDRAFAETFALPEFSLSRGGAQRAAARMASILASYSDIPEETATKMLANDLLIAELQTKRTDQEFAQTVESAVAAENAHLVEERAALAAQVELEKRAREAKDLELAKVAQLLHDREQALVVQARELKAKEDAIGDLESRSADQRRLISQTTQSAAEAHGAREETTRRVAELEAQVAVADQRRERTAKVASIAVAIAAIGWFEVMIRFVTPWTWLLNHPNGFGLEGCMVLMIAFGIVGIGVKQWRSTLWVVGFLSVVLVFLGIIGGRNTAAL